MSELKKILENFCKLDGVRAALLVGSDGVLHESHEERELDSTRVAALVAACSGLGARTADELGLEVVSQSYIVYDNFNITFEAIADRTLVIVADPGANLGRIRLEIRKNKKNIEATGE